MDFSRMLAYCGRLELNNNRPWFHENHDEYEAAKADFEDLLDCVKFAVAEGCDRELMEHILPVKPKDMMYRIPRDARVCKNLPPYNPSFRAYVSGDRHALLPLGYFICIQPGGRSLFGTGVYSPEGAKVTSVRDFIMDNFEELDGILSENGLTLCGDRLKRVPAGYPADHPASEYIKFKSWSVIDDIADRELDSFSAFEALIREKVRRMEPLRRYLTRALTGQSPDDEADEL